MERTFKPLYVFILLLLVITVVQITLTQLLPLPARHSIAAPPLWNCTVLAAVVATFVWWLIVHPMKTAARKESHRTRATLENVIDSVIHFDVDGRIESCNAAAQRLFGLSPGEMIGGNIEALFPRDHGLLVRAQGASFETTVHHKNGAPFSVEVSISGMQFGRSSSYVAIIHDITNRVQSELRILESEKRYHALFDNMLNGFGYWKMLFDEEGRPSDFLCLSVNKAFVRLTGLDEMVGRKVTEAIPGIAEVHPELFELYGRVVTTGVPDTLELEFMPLGKWFFISAFTPEPGHFVTIFEEITGRKEAEQEILKAKDDWERTFNAIVDPIMILDKGHRIVRANKAMAAKFGLNECGLNGKLCSSCVHHTQQPLPSCPHSRLLQDGRPHHEEIYEPKLDAYFDIDVSPLFDREGELLGSIHIARDITERKNLEKQLLHSQKMQAMGNLAGGVAHDFNNILTAIIGYGGLVQMTLPKESQAYAQMKEVLKAADRAAELSGSLLAFSRKQKAVLKSVELNTAIHDAKKMLKRLIRGDIEFNAELAPEALNIMADAGQLEQVLMNLVANAQDAINGPGTLSISTKEVVLDKEFKIHHGCGEPGQYALITVSDTGCGMDEQTRQRIFEPFFTTKGVGKGTGLGLSIAYGIVQKHDGFMHCHSEIGIGTTFRIFIPLAAKLTVGGQPAVDPPLPTGSETILVAEDDEQARSLLKDLLEKFGYRVMAAADGAEALSMLKGHRDEVSLALLDAVMPNMNGTTACGLMLEVKPDLRVVITSGYPQEMLTDLGSDDQKVTSLMKPVRPSEILVMIRELLDDRHATTQPAVS